MKQERKISLSDLFPSIQQGVWAIGIIGATLLFIIQPVWEMRKDLALSNERYLATIAELKRTNEELSETNENLKELATKVNDNENELGTLDIRIENLEERRFQSLAPTADTGTKITYNYSSKNEKIQAAEKKEEEKDAEQEAPEDGESQGLLDQGRNLIEALGNLGKAR